MTVYHFGKSIIAVPIAQAKVLKPTLGVFLCLICLALAFLVSFMAPSRRSRVEVFSVFLFSSVTAVLVEWERETDRRRKKTRDQLVEDYWT